MACLSVSSSMQVLNRMSICRSGQRLQDPAAAAQAGPSQSRLSKRSRLGPGAASNSATASVAARTRTVQNGAAEAGKGVPVSASLPEPSHAGSQSKKRREAITGEVMRPRPKHARSASGTPSGAAPTGSGAAAGLNPQLPAAASTMPDLAARSASQRHPAASRRPQQAAAEPKHSQLAAAADSIRQPAAVSASQEHPAASEGAQQAAAALLSKQHQAATKSNRQAAALSVALHTAGELAQACAPQQEDARPAGLASTDRPMADVSAERRRAEPPSEDGAAHDGNTTEESGPGEGQAAPSDEEPECQQEAGTDQASLVADSGEQLEQPGTAAAADDAPVNSNKKIDSSSSREEESSSGEESQLRGGVRLRGGEQWR